MSTLNNNRVWLITGASRGLGLSITEAALAHGDGVIATARNAKSITKRLGEKAGLLALDLDVTDERQISFAIETAIATFGRIDVLVNNAGYGMSGAIEEASPEEIRHIYDTNVFGVLNVTRAVLPHMRKQRSGHVISISSAGGYRSFPGHGIYCSTKFAVEGISEALYGELAPLGIRVTVVEPGFFRTDFLEDTSVVESHKVIEDYDSTSGEARRSVNLYNRQQAGDPAKLAQAMLTLVAVENPPQRLQMGTDALAMVEAKNAVVQQEMTAWRELSASTNF